MKMLKNTRTKLAYFVLQKKAKTIVRNKTFHNFDSAKSAGIIFDATFQNKYLATKAFMGYLANKGIDVNALGYVAEKSNMGYFPFQKDTQYFSLDTLDILEKPISQDVDNFIERKFDILINLCTDELYPIQYIIAMSKAKFKISKKFNLNFSDFMLDIQGSTTIEDFIAQIKHYISALSKS